MQSILIIEDDSDILANLAEYLELEGFAVSQANSGSKGISLAKEIVPDLIICDILMPEVNGFQVLRSVLQNPNTCEIPFIFSSAMSDGLCVSEAQNDGADDYIVKPYNLDALLDVVKTRLKTGSKRHH